MKALKLILLAVVCCAAMATAEDKKIEMQGMPEMGPPKEMAAMAGLVGTWTCEMKMKMAPTDTAWGAMSGSASYKMELGGAALRMDFAGDMMGMPFNGISYMTYDREMKQWQSMWVDGMGARIDMTYGNPDKDGKIVMTGESMMQGQKFMVRQTTTIVSPTKHEWMYEMSMDGGKTWWTSMTAVYTKK